MKEMSPALVVLEASGGLELPLVAALAAAELPVVVVNPRQVRDFARATGTLAKTDLWQVLAVSTDAGSAVGAPMLRPRPSTRTARRHQVMTMLLGEEPLGYRHHAVRPRIESPGWSRSWTILTMG